MRMQYAISVKEELLRVRLPNHPKEFVIQWHGLILSVAHVFEWKTRSLKEPLVHSERILDFLKCSFYPSGPAQVSVPSSYKLFFFPFSETQRKQEFNPRGI